MQFVATPTAAQFRRDYATAGRPALLRGIFDDWPAFTRWSARYFREHCGAHKVRVAIADKPDGAIELRQGAAGARSSVVVDLATGLRLVHRRGGPLAYLAAVSLTRDLPRLAADIVVPEFLAGTPVVDARLWYGPCGVVTPTHFDAAHVVLTQLSGHKRVSLFAPEDWHNLYPFEADGPAFPTSRLDIDRVDLAAHPLYRNATRIEIDLHKGDALFIPAFWAHHVRTVRRSTSVSFLCKAPLSCWNGPAAREMLRRQSLAAGVRRALRSIDVGADSLPGCARALLENNEPALAAKLLREELGRDGASLPIQAWLKEPAADADVTRLRAVIDALDETPAEAPELSDASVTASPAELQKQLNAAVARRAVIHSRWCAVTFYEVTPAPEVAALEAEERALVAKIQHLKQRTGG